MAIFLDPTLGAGRVVRVNGSCYTLVATSTMPENGVDIDASFEACADCGGQSIPMGTAQYQVYQMTAANVAGWDFPRAHP
jgi:hypothetical protein